MPLLPLCRLSATESGLDEEREGPSFSEEEDECSGGCRVDRGADRGADRGTDRGADAGGTTEAAAAEAELGGRRGVGRWKPPLALPPLEESGGGG